jgi:L-threonylcarbamoyladenylate synthase
MGSTGAGIVADPRQGTVPDGLVTVDVARAVASIVAGGLVAMPTETVYGLGGDATNDGAVARIFAVKGRPTGHPLIVHIAAAEALDDWAAEVPRFVRDLAETCWPGPLTMLLRRSAQVPDSVTGGRDTVGLRVPAHPMALDLLARSGRGIAAPSANRFGRVSPTTAQHVLDDLGSLLDPARDLILDGGASPVGVESTIVDCSVSPPQVLRPGGIPIADIEAVLGSSLAAAAGPSRAAGMLASHYAPRATVELAESSDAARRRAAALAAAGEQVRILDYGDDLVLAARSLYADLRDADGAGTARVIAVMPPAVGLGHAIRDRLTKAAAAR